MGPPAVNAELEQQILLDPDRPEPYLVYADWLQGQGDPRGELITVQHALMQATGSEAARLAERKVALQSELEAHLLGPLKAFRDAPKPEKSWHGGRKLELGWKLGFIHSADIVFRYHEEKDLVPAELLETFFKLPAARFLREFKVGPVPADDMMSFDSVMEAIADSCTSSLSRLDIGERGKWDISGVTLGPASPLFAMLPRLQALTLTGGSITLGVIDAPELRDFRVQTGSLGLAEVQAICTARWPKLERLDVWFGNPDYGAEGGLEDIAPLLRGDGLASLKRLGLMNAMFTDEICGAIADAPVLAQLEVLDLSMGTMTDEGAAALASRGDAFRHLKLLNVDDNGLSAVGLERLSGLCARVESTSQDEGRVDEEHRYTSVGE